MHHELLPEYCRRPSQPLINRLSNSPSLINRLQDAPPDRAQQTTTAVLLVQRVIQERLPSPGLTTSKTAPRSSSQTFPRAAVFVDKEGASAVREWGSARRK
jgi:hypothetical protein